MSIKDTDFLKSGLFTPTVIRGLTNGRASTFQSVVGADLTGSNITSTSSFRYDSPGTGLKSSQQVPVDFSRFENHTFFNSAESNVNVAFDKTINGFPFDGNRKELENFFDNLSGFEKWTYDQFPKSKNVMYFGGPAGVGKPAAPVENYIVVDDYAGSIFPNLSRKVDGSGILDPGLKSFAVEMWLWIPNVNVTSGSGVILQKVSQSAGKTDGFTISNNDLSASSGKTRLEMIFTSGSRVAEAYVDVDKNSYNKLLFQFNREAGQNRIEIFVNNVLSSATYTGGYEYSEFGEIDFKNSPLTIGSGSSHYADGDTWLTSEYFSGTIDELRIFHSVRTVSEQIDNQYSTIYPDDNLKLYYKFNESTGSYAGNDIILDSSGNSLHARMTNFDPAAREFSEATNPMILEDSRFNPVLFPTQQDVVSLHSTLIASASQYDANNPNLITQLVPRHYLLEGGLSEGFENEDGDMGEGISATETFPGGAEFGSAQILSTFLFLWAKYFDEMKIFMDQFSKLNHVDYTSDNNIADTFLPFYAKQLGFDLPTQFTVESLESYLEATNLLTEQGLSSRNVVEIQNLIWRRILTTLKEVVRSRGTQHSVKSFLRSIGLEPNQNFRIREYGGKTQNKLRYSTESRVTDIRFLDFSGSLATVTPTLDAQGFPDNKPHFVTNFLSGARVEPGQPLQQGTFVGGLSDNKNDGLFTSSSFSYEAIYRFDSPLSGSHPLTQSLSRLNITSSISSLGADLYPSPTPLLNLVAFSPDVNVGTTGSIQLYVNEGFGTSTAVNKTEVVLNDINIFDGNNWHIGYKREILTQKSASFSVFANKIGIEFESLKQANSVYPYEGSGVNLLFSNVEPLGIKYNSSGSFVTIGSQSLNAVTPGAEIGLLDPTNNPDENARYTDFTGKVSSINFWSKALTDDEIKWHTLDPTSVGVTDPYINFNFETSLSGTFERLRLNFDMNQPVTESDSSGNISITDFSQAAVSGTIDRPFDPATTSRLLTFNGQARGFETGTRVIEKRKVRHIIRSSKFDVNSTDNKVRIRTLQNENIVPDAGAELYGSIATQENQGILDDSRFAIEIESVQALDEDIMRIFGTMQALDDALGGAESMYHDEYPKLRLLRQIYFNKLVDKVNLTAFFEFFRYFDDSITAFVEKILPHNTDFLGVNFTIGPHVLERQRFRYLNDDIYLQESDRTLIGDDLGPEIIDSL
jgi:hypothetical protein